MFDILRGRKFSKKSKHSMKCIKCRIEAIRNKRQAMLRYFKKDIADLLAGGHDVNAFGRMDALIVEVNLLSCYDMIEQYCGCVLEHLSTMRKQRECPEEAMEAVATLIFAAARLSNLPELADLRAVFTMRYGTQMEPCINTQFVEKTQKKSFSKDMKLQLMEDIAQEFSVNWNVKMFESKISNQAAPNHPPRIQNPDFAPVQKHQAMIRESANGDSDFPEQKSRVSTTSNQNKNDSVFEDQKSINHDEFTPKTSNDGKNRPVNAACSRTFNLHQYVKSQANKTPPRIEYANSRDYEKSNGGRDDDHNRKDGSTHSRLWDYESLAAEIAALSNSSKVKV